MKIIIAGLPKTGTTSVAEGLRILGYSVYDLPEQLVYQRNQWKQILDNGTNSKKLLHEMFKAIDAGCDAPFVAYWWEIFECFPKSKVILCIRDSEDSWLRSMKKQMKEMTNMLQRMRLIFKIIPSGQSTFRVFKKWAQITTGDKCSSRDWFYSLKIDDDLAKYTYRNHIMKVKNTIPNDQLLVYNVKSGWDPLCKFLNKPVPTSHFPKANVGASNTKDIHNFAFQRISFEIFVLTLVLVALLCFIYYFIVYYLF